MTPERKEGLPHLVGLLAGVVALVVGLGLLFGPYFLPGLPHSNVRDVLGGLCLAFAFVCAVPSKVDKAASVFRRVKYDRRSSDRVDGPYVDYREPAQKGTRGGPGE